MRVKETSVFKFDELSDTAKERARDLFWTEHVLDDAAKIAGLLGVELNTREVKLVGGGTKREPVIWWSLDGPSGVCFSARYRYVKGSTKAIAGYAPQDETLRSIAKGLLAAQARNFYRIVADCQAHDRHMTISFDDVSDHEVNERDFGTVTEWLRDFAHWIYKRLSDEYEHVNSEEQTDESIRANEYEFDEEGRRA